MINLTQETAIKIVETKNISEALKVAKKVVTFHDHPHSARILIAFNGSQFMAIGQSGITVAVARCEFENNHSFVATVPLVKNVNKEQGFTAFQRVLTAQKITDQFSYSIEDTEDNSKLVCKSLERKSTFKFNLIADSEDNYAFPLPTDLSLIVNDFMNKKDEEIEETETIEEIEETEIEIVESIVTEEIEVAHKVETIESDDYYEVVPGVGEIIRLQCDQLNVGMYLYFNNILYTISNIEQVDFINHNGSYILTVANLLHAADYQKIILGNNDLVTAWMVNFDIPVPKVKKDSTPKIAIASEVMLDANESIDSSVPSKVRAATHDRGIKGSGRYMLLKMLRTPVTLEQIESSFNWSHKTASNHMTYVRQWGYNLQRTGDLYQII